jgi:hypothetical protein
VNGREAARGVEPLAAAIPVTGLRTEPNLWQMKL